MGCVCSYQLRICHFLVAFLAQNGFARLMGLESTSPLTTENDGLDSGLGGALPNIAARPTDTEPVETETSEVVEKATLTHKTRGKMRNAKLEESLLLPLLILDETESQSPRRSSRKKQKSDLESDKILEQRQKRSVEKVAEWLMKVPAEESLELEKPVTQTDTCDPDDSDNSSTTSTINVRLHYSDMNPKREDRAKALEEQVFGVVYKRDRRGTRTTSPPLNVEPPTDPLTIQTMTPKKVSKGKKNRITSAEFIEKSSTGDNYESDMEEEQINNTCSENIKEAEEIVTEENNEKGDKSEGQFNDDDDKDDFPSCLLSDTERHQPARKSKKGMRDTLQHVDSDLKEQTKANVESSDQKKTDKRKGKNSKSEKSKSGRVVKPLVLVGVQNGETSPKTRQVQEVQVHIENYSSSEGHQTPMTRSTRRSRRLKLFAEEIQEGPKKACPPTKTRTSIHGKDSSATEESEDTKNGTLCKSASPENGNLAKMNGCIYDQDIGGIENMEFGERTTSLRPTEDVTSVKESITETLSEAVEDPQLENDNLTDQCPNSIHLETKCATKETEEDRNDSELDTEQLLKSFKSTKRKSFHLGGPDVKRSRGLYEENVREETSDAASGALGKKMLRNSDITNQPVLKDSDSSPCSDLISPSNSPTVTRNGVTKIGDQMVEEGLIPDTSSSVQDNTKNSVSSALSPNKVSKHEIQIPHLSVVPQIVDSGVCFRAVELSEGGECEELNEPTRCSQITERELGSTARDAEKVTEIRDNVSQENSAGSGKQRSVSASEGFLIAESSLTPDGLEIPVVQLSPEIKMSSHGSGEFSVHSSFKSNPRKRKKAQKLESSSDSDCSGSKEELPTLTQIFGTSAPPSAVRLNAQDQGNSSCEGACVTADEAEQLRRPPACPSPDCLNSSQESLDLFGTPNECKSILII